ncbi:transcriptional repressor CTCF isoform X2 [Bicyclus anynana]|uniref:Transcriptional repressor CTCF isoform X2 n=1 Tax=Bicyclus anynana TaxID=110368 RepID=A0ABM3M4T9_BICAN|nr:transcriptional repressor CTCF isoform X2 [Bicyclus anynana]
MPPPEKKSSVLHKTILQTYLDSFEQHDEDSTTTVIAVNGSGDEADTGVTYFMDEEGRYYYQPSADSQNLVSLPVEQDEDSTEETQILVDGEGYQTMTFVPSEGNGTEMSYVLVVQEETKPVINIDIKDEEEKTCDVYAFDEEELEDSDDDDTEAIPTKTKNRQNRPEYTCGVCKYSSHRRYLLLRHMKTHSDERPHKCNVCERGFKTVAALQNHVNMHNGIKPHVCKYCKSPFTTSGELVRHVRYRHTHEKPHKCTECDYASVERSKLRRHVRCHTGERPYQCSHCTYASQDTFKLKRHLRTHTGEKPYKCDNCNMCFTQSNSLKAHKLIHNVSDKPVFQCELCPTKCGRKTDLRIHIQKLHTSNKPHKCKRCGKSFPDRYSLKMHNKTHEGEKCFKCELCPYASTTLRHLKSHMLKHTDEKPFACDQCDQSFRQKQLLRRHQNLYHNPNYEPKPPKEKTHTCHECKRTFAHKGNLIRHLAIHDPESGHLERALALKLGRQKKIHFVDTNAKLQSSNSEDEGEELMKIDLSGKQLERGELLTVADGDGQQYVVLEVIQTDDSDDHKISVPDYIEEKEEEEEEEEEVEMDKKEILEQINARALERTIKVEKDVDACFGFDDDEEQEEEDEEMNYKESKIVMRLV